MLAPASFSVNDLDHLVEYVRDSLTIYFQGGVGFPQPLALHGVPSPHAGLSGNFWLKGEVLDFRTGRIPNADWGRSVPKGPCLTATSIIQFADEPHVTRIGHVRRIEADPSDEEAARKRKMRLMWILAVVHQWTGGRIASSWCGVPSGLLTEIATVARRELGDDAPAWHHKSEPLPQSLVQQLARSGLISGPSNLYQVADLLALEIGHLGANYDLVHYAPSSAPHPRAREPVVLRLVPQPEDTEKPR